jgi:hypothetical protein
MSYKDDVRQLVITTINRNLGRTMSDEAGQSLIEGFAASLAMVDPAADPSGIDVEQMWREVQAQCAIWVDDGRAHLRTWHRDFRDAWPAPTGTSGRAIAPFWTANPSSRQAA